MTGRYGHMASENRTKKTALKKELISACPALSPLRKLLHEALFNTSHGGSVDISHPLKLYIHEQDSSATVISLPPSEAEQEQLLKACEPASFGKGSEEVLDPEYRQALKLDKSKFSLNAELHSTSLLDEIKAALCPDHGNVTLTAELDKLNVYTEGGFFKEHKDTPRANNFIGTLVLVLPSAFEGGELIVQNMNTSASKQENPANTSGAPIKSAERSKAEQSSTATTTEEGKEAKPAKKVLAKPKSSTFAWPDKSK